MSRLDGVFNQLFPNVKGRHIVIGKISREEREFYEATDRLRNPPPSRRLAKSAPIERRLSAAIDEAHDIRRASKAADALLTDIDARLARLEKGQARDVVAGQSHALASNERKLRW
jgi:hypothetical protein